MTQEIVEADETRNEAITVVQILISFEAPKVISELPGWLERVKNLQSLLSNLWEKDNTGKVMVECLTVLYDLIALKQFPVSPAVWSVLDLVEERKICEIVERILNDPSTNVSAKVQNALLAILDGLCQFGAGAPRLQDWTMALVRGLERRGNYVLLNTVAECIIDKLMKGFQMPLYRQLIYPVFRMFLYSSVSPRVFLKIIDLVPDAIRELEKDSDDEDTRICLNDFAGVLQNILTRYAQNPNLMDQYEAIGTALMRIPDATFEPDNLPLWDPDADSDFLTFEVEPVYSICFDTTKNLLYKGLVNQGNTCFMNSVLQMLYMTTRFRNEILMKEVDITERAAADLQELFAFMQESSRNVLLPYAVIDSTLPPTFRRGHQQDSSEYLIHLLDILHEKEKNVIQRRKEGILPFENFWENSVGGNGDAEEVGAGSVKEPEVLQDEYTIVEKLFGGTAISTTVCSFCEKSFPKTDAFRDLHLSIPDDQTYCDLQDLINNSLQPEELSGENQYDCSNCGTKRNATRKQTIIRAPEHLILTLKLFRFDPVRRRRVKLKSKLKSSYTVNIPVFSSSQLEPKVVTYELKAVVLHSGNSLDGGHYFSAAVDQSGQWYLFNDSVVTVARCEWSEESGTPYILVLRQSDVSDPPKNPLPNGLQMLVNRDNEKYLAETCYQPRRKGKKDYDDDYDGSPPNNGSLGGPGPSLVF